MIMQILVQHGKETYQVACEEGDTVESLMKKVKNASGILARYQKLIYKGKTLEHRSTLAQAKMKEGAKLMLMASSTPVQTQVWHKKKGLVGCTSILIYTSMPDVGRIRPSFYVHCQGWHPRLTFLRRNAADLRYILSRGKQLRARP